MNRARVLNQFLVIKDIFCKKKIVLYLGIKGLIGLYNRDCACVLCGTDRACIIQVTRMCDRCVNSGTVIEFLSQLDHLAT